jgi:hypothetical protein
MLAKTAAVILDIILGFMVILLGLRAGGIRLAVKPAPCSHLRTISGTAQAVVLLFMTILPSFVTNSLVTGRSAN